MRLCFIADMVSIHAHRWTNYFAGTGNEVHLITRRFESGGEGLDASVQIHRLARLVPLPQASNAAVLASAAVWSCQVWGLVHRLKPDVVHAHFLGVPGYLGALAGYHPFVLSVWGSDALIIPRRNPLYGLLTRLALKRADRVIAVSEALAEESRRLGAGSSKIMVTPIGVDTEKFTPAARDRVVFEQLGMGDSLVVISSRSLKPIYDVETLVRAIPLVVEKVPQARFLIIGDGPQRTCLQDLARQLGVSSSVDFMGRVSDANYPVLMASSDVYVSTSLSDGTSISLLEALASGVTPVVSDIPANRPWVVDGENGFLFPVRNEEQLAARVITLLTDSKERERFGGLCRKMAADRARFRTEMARVERLYQELKLDPAR